MRKVTIIGHYGYGLDYCDGQTIKTKNITEEIHRYYGKDEVYTIDSHGRLKSLVKAPFQLFLAIKNSKSVIILPAHNSLKVYTPLLSFYRSFFKSRKLYYIVIGGWLPKVVANNRVLRHLLRKFDGIFVETSTMRNALEELGFTNVNIMPNVKKTGILQINELVKPVYPYKFCIFSRITPMKGVEDAVETVKRVNCMNQNLQIALDIYGQVFPEDKEWFDSLSNEFPDNVSYKGIVPSEKSTEILKDYYCVLFPTHYYTEGIPGTIVDSYAAGVPVIASMWQNFSDVVIEGKTGFGYSFKDREDLFNVLVRVSQNPSLVNEMKKECLLAAQKYKAEKVMEILFNEIDR